MKKIILPLTILASIMTLIGAVLPQIPSIGSDKILHILEYLILAYLIFTTQKILKQKLWVSLIILTIIAIGTEIIQNQLSYRTFSYFDMIANFIGIGIAGVLKWISSKE